MIRIWSQLIGTFILAFLAGGAMTGAFFNDAEGSGGMFGAFKLDAELTGSGFTGNICSVGDPQVSTFAVRNIGGLSFEYELRTENIVSEDTFCDVLVLDASRNGGSVYTGPLAGFNLGIYPLAYGMEDTWELVLSIPEGTPWQNVNGKSCTFETVLAANQHDFLSGQAFFDIETLPHMIMGQAGGGGGLGDVTIIIDNNATVTNNVNVSSNTGGNSANGGNGGSGGDGGAGGGDGGDGGDGGNGGTIRTGDSSSSVVITNVINTNETTVTGCGCSTCGCTSCGGDCGSTDDEHDKKKKEKTALIRTITSEEAAALEAEQESAQSSSVVTQSVTVSTGTGGSTESGSDGDSGDGGESNTSDEETVVQIRTERAPREAR